MKKTSSDSLPSKQKYKPMPENSLLITPIYAYSDNYIWCISNDKQQAWVVDPGHAGVVETHLKNNTLSLEGILITHHHWDHITGISELTKHRDIPVYGPDSEKIQEITHPLYEGNTLSVFNRKVSVIQVPGHTKDHIAYLLSDENAPNALFCGDTLFSAGCGRLFDGTIHQLYASLNTLSTLNNDTKVYCTHEYTLANLEFAQAADPNNDAIKQEMIRVNTLDLNTTPSIPTTIEKEKAINPFLRCDQLSVQQTVTRAKQLTADNITEEEYFIALRQWKDTF